MASDSFSLASDPVGFGRDGAPPSKPEQPALPVQEATSARAEPSTSGAKPSRLKSAGNAFADLVMGVGVFVTGGIFGLLGYRRVTGLRLMIEAGIVAVLAAALYYTTKTWLHPYADAVDLGDPLQRAVLFVLCAVVLAYAGGMVVHVGWHRKGDPKASMLVVAVGMTLIGLRIASAALAFGEIKAVDMRVEAGAAGLKAIMSAVDVMKAQGVDPKPVAPVILDFQKSIYGNKYVEGFYATGDKAPVGVKPSDFDLPESRSGSSEAAGDGQQPPSRSPVDQPPDVSGIGGSAAAEQGDLPMALPPNQ